MPEEEELQAAAEAAVAAQPASQNTVDQIIESLTAFAISALAALVILIIGLFIAKKVKNIFANALNKKGVDATLVGFFSSLLYGAIAVFVVIAAIGKLGVQTTSFAAVIAAAGLAIGLALQGSLSNFASGVLLILFKPFVAGNVIKAGGEIGSVVEVGLLTTELKTPDNVKIIMPNSAIMGGSITNISAHPTRRVDMVVGVGYGDDLNKAKQIMEDLLAADERVLKDPAVTIAVSNLGDSSVDFVVRPWVNAADYWAVKFDFTKAVKEAFDAQGISIPYPQRDVHMHTVSAS
ncbi:MAG: mechanosensitive ion channel [Opitutales bacterium]|jgi:small conductance mechanosensitive channel|nr:mechanosensitive ion channel [Opitutales bacterium]MDP4882611.1 mechanosensitive ion channel [Opitutales bacterium]MDP5080771.1 mechanosensitive ion channel [Opitutales bacterium]